MKEIPSNDTPSFLFEVYMRLIPSRDKIELVKSIIFKFSPKVLFFAKKNSFIKLDTLDIKVPLLILLVVSLTTYSFVLSKSLTSKVGHRICFAPNHIV